MDSPRTQADSGDDPRRMAGLLSAVVSEMGSLSPCFELLRRQLAGALELTDAGVLAVINRINEVYDLSRRQVDPIQQSMDQCALLADITRKQSGCFQQMVRLVKAEIESHLEELDSNIRRTQDLADEVGKLKKIVEMITDIGAQTRLLAINASIQATHAGAAGAAFSVVASEVKVLSLRTTEASKDIAARIGELTKRMAGELAAVKKTSSAVQGAAENLQNVIRDLSAIEAQFDSASGVLQGMISGIQASNRDVTAQLTEALGHIQFQDIVRQRVEQVELALEDLGQHTRMMVGNLTDETWDGRIQPTLQQRLEQHQAGYVMASQRDTHASVLGGHPASSLDGPAIELF